jgi:hypothetical protein
MRRVHGVRLGVPIPSYLPYKVDGALQSLAMYMNFTL